MRSARTEARIGKFDFAERDAANRGLGKRGEEWVFQIERLRLQRAGASTLAKKVEWTSEAIGDGTGYDIRSFEPDGRDLFIEVKTTNLGKGHSFIVTANEEFVSRAL